MSRLGRVVDLLGRRGVGYPWSVITDVLVPMAARAPLRRGWKRSVRALERLTEPRIEAPSALPALAAGSVVASLDGDGYALGEVAGFPSVEPSVALPRRRFDLQLVDAGATRFVRKGYRGDQQSWRRELAAMKRLADAGVGAPRVLGADASSTTTDKSLIEGRTLRDLLVEGGAAILSRETQSDPALTGLTAGEQVREIWARGRAAFGVLPAGFLDALARQLDAVHRAGVTGVALTFGNVVVDATDGGPVFIDFDNTSTHRSTATLGFAAARDRDRRLFNEIYGSNLLTESTAAALLREVGRTNYAPLDLGAGLVTRGFWSVDSGTGRWEYLNHRVLAPLLPGARVLDLGSHNGILPLLMLREGARSVVAVERDPELVGYARTLHRLFEWREMRPLDLEIRNDDMLAAAGGAVGPFDLVTAFCSLYYLEPDAMAAVVRRAAELAPTMVLQAKTDTRQEAADGKALKSGITVLRDLLIENGFPTVKVHSPPGFTRPLLVGRRTGARDSGT